MAWPACAIQFATWPERMAWASRPAWVVARLPPLIARRRATACRAVRRSKVAWQTCRRGVPRLRRWLIGEGEPAAAAGYFFGHFACGFVDHLTFETDCAATFAFGGLAIRGQNAFGSGVDQRIGRVDAV